MFWGPWAGCPAESDKTRSHTLVKCLNERAQGNGDGNAKGGERRETQTYRTDPHGRKDTP